MAYGEEFGNRLSSEYIKDRAAQMRESAREIRQLEVYSPPPHGPAEQSYVSAKDASTSLGLYGDNEKIATSLITSLVDGKSMMEVAKEARGAGFEQRLIGELLRRGTRMRIEAQATQRPVMTPRFNKSLDDDQLIKANRRQRRKAAKKAGAGAGAGGGNKPPSGFSPVPKSSKGGYRKMEGHGYTYWYPGQGLSHEPHAEDHGDVHHTHAKDLQGRADQAKAKLKPSPEVHKKYMEMKERARESGIEITGKHPHGGTTIEEMDKIEKDLEHHIATKKAKAETLQSAQIQDGELSEEEELADFSAQLDEMENILNDVDTSGLSKEDTAKFEGFSKQILDLRSQIEEAQKAQKKGKKGTSSDEGEEREDLTPRERIKNALWALRHIVIAMTIGTLTGGAQGGLRGLQVGSKKAMTETAQLKELGKAVKEAKTAKEKAKVDEAEATVDKDEAKTDKDKAKVAEAKAKVAKPKAKKSLYLDLSTDRLVLTKGGEGSRGGKIIGHTSSGKPVYASSGGKPSGHTGFTAKDHAEAAEHHRDSAEQLRRMASGGSARSAISRRRELRERAKHHAEVSAHHEAASKKVKPPEPKKAKHLKSPGMTTSQAVALTHDAGHGGKWGSIAAKKRETGDWGSAIHHVLGESGKKLVEKHNETVSKAGWASIPGGKKGGQRRRARNGKWEYRYGVSKRDKDHEASVEAWRSGKNPSNEEVFLLLNKKRRREIYEAAAMEIQPQSVARRLAHAFADEKKEWQDAARGARHFFSKPPPPTSREKQAMFKVSLNSLVGILAAPMGPLAVVSTLAGNFALHVVSKAVISVIRTTLDPTDKLLILNDALEILSYFKSEEMSDKKYLEAFVALVGKRVQEILRNDELTAAELKAIVQGSSPPTLKKSMVKGGGPFIGKRGGKWANPEHTIPWHDTSGDSVGHKHATAAREVVAQFDGDHSAALEQLREMGEGKIFDAVSREMIPSNKLVEHLDAWTPTKPAAEHDMVTVHHTTDKDTAERMLRDGVIPQHKPVTQAQRDYQAGHHATFGPGAGVSGGIYVAKPGASDSYGQVTLKIRVPRAHLKVSPEQARHGVTDPHASLHTHDGAVVEHAVHHSQIELVKSDLAKGGPFIGPRGGKWADAKHTIPYKEGGTQDKPRLREFTDESGTKHSISPSDEEIREQAGYAHKKLNGAVAEWVHRNDDEARAKIFEIEASLPPISKAALAFQIEDIVREQSGGEWLTVYRAMKPGDDPKKLAGASVTTDPKLWSHMGSTQAFRVHHSAILLHHKQGELPRHQRSALGSSDHWAHEQEIILRPGASKIESLGPVAKSYFTGPRGGKWKDAKHTIPYKEDKKPRAKAKPKKKPKGKPPGSQLSPTIRARLKEHGVTKLPAAEIPVETIRIDFNDPDTTAVIKWRDSKNRIQSGYTPAFHKANAKKKWARVMQYRDKFPAIKRSLQAKLKKGKPGSTEHQGVLIANIIALTGLRPGSTQSAKKLQHHGASTLTPNHVKIDGSKVEIEYVGKSGKTNVATIRNKAVAEALGHYMKGKKENQPLFNTKALLAARESLPQGAMLKDLRTIVATTTAARVLDESTVPPPLTGDKKKDKRLLAKALKEATKVVAEVLNNTPAVAASTYIHPEVFKKWAIDKAGAHPSLFEEI